MNKHRAAHPKKADAFPVAGAKHSGRRSVENKDGNTAYACSHSQRNLRSLVYAQPRAAGAKWMFFSQRCSLESHLQKGDECVFC